MKLLWKKKARWGKHAWRTKQKKHERMPFEKTSKLIGRLTRHYALWLVKNHLPYFYETVKNHFEQKVPNNLEELETVAAFTSCFHYTSHSPVKRYYVSIQKNILLFCYNSLYLRCRITSAMHQFFDGVLFDSLNSGSPGTATGQANLLSKSE